MYHYCSSTSNYIYVLHQFLVLNDAEHPEQIQAEMPRRENNQYSSRKRGCDWNSGVSQNGRDEFHHATPNEAIPESDNASLAANIDSDEHNSTTENIPGEIGILTTFR